MPSLPQRLEILRQFRGPRIFGRPVVGDIARIQRNVERAGKHLSVMIDLWERHLPPHLASRTRITSIRSGVAHVVAESSGVLFELDRLLRGGLERGMIEEASFPLRRVKCVIGCLNDPGFASQ